MPSDPQVKEQQELIKGSQLCFPVDEQRIER